MSVHGTWPKKRNPVEPVDMKKILQAVNSPARSLHHFSNCQSLSVSSQTAWSEDKHPNHEAIASSWVFCLASADNIINYVSLQLYMQLQAQYMVES